MIRNHDERLLDWVNELCPELGQKVNRAIYTRALISELSIAVVFPQYKTYYQIIKLNKKAYVRFLKGLKKHISNNPDVIAFALL